MIVIVGLLVAFVLLAIYARPGTRGCRWRADRTRDVEGRSFYACAACGAQVLRADGKPPKTCMKGPAR